MMDISEDVAALERQLDATPDDMTLRLVYADALEESGRGKEGEFQRLLVGLSIFPCRVNAVRTNLWWYWSKGGKLPGAAFPEAVMDWLLERNTSNPGYFGCRSRESAEEGLFRAWLEGVWDGVTPCR